jgi:hypothetical protein
MLRRPGRFRRLQETHRKTGQVNGIKNGITDLSQIE